MSDSNITKKAMAEALKELMKDLSFEKINVTHICEKCDMNRKSFYYHFKDKYDLVNWIFDTEFISVIKKQQLSDYWILLEQLFIYFYDNRNFYRKALQVKGQNSFSEHFREFAGPVTRNSLESLLGGDEVQDFYIDFINDALICAIERWLLDKDSMDPEKFFGMIKHFVENSAVAICQKMVEDENKEHSSVN